MPSHIVGAYSGATLVDLVDNLEEASMKAGEDLANSMVNHGMNLIRKNTPVETYHLRGSYRRTPIKYGQDPTLGYTSIRWSAYAWTGRVFTEVEYAPFVDRGTGLWGPKRAKYKIQPKKPGGVLAFTPYSRLPGGGVVLDVEGSPGRSGHPIFVRFVMHPGSPGAHMFQIGATLTEAEHEEWSREPMRLWKERVEQKV